MWNILFIPDCHFRDKDFRSMSGYVKNIDKLFDELESVIERKSINMLIFLGDVFDCGYTNINIYQSHINRLEKLVKLVNGEAYLNVGNHFFVNKQRNPEVYCAQPTQIASAEYKPTAYFVPRDEALLKVVDNLFLNGVQIAFHHYTAKKKDYTTQRFPIATKVIACYHDSVCLPHNVLQRLNMFEHVQSGNLDDIYYGVDYAVHGHIHIPFGVTAYKNTVLNIPGSLAPTKIDEVDYGNISLPLYMISDSGELTYELVDFDRHLDSLIKLDKKDLDITVSPEKVKKASLVPTGNVAYQTISEYVSKKGLPNSIIELLEKAHTGELDINAVHSIAKGTTSEFADLEL